MNERLIVQKFLIIVLSGIISSVAVAQKQPVAKKKYNQSKQIEDQIGYTHAVQAGSVLYISGTVATGDMQKQVREIMESIKQTLSTYDANFGNVVKENVYTTDLDSFIMHKNIRSEYYKNDYPAATWVEVKRLYLPQYQVEIEVIAQLPNKN
jgi:enamine deaminase RidA (YjgF/YER057c/UK114 family)